MSKRKQRISEEEIKIFIAADREFPCALCHRLDYEIVPRGDDGRFNVLEWPVSVVVNWGDERFVLCRSCLSRISSDPNLNRRIRRSRGMAWLLDRIGLHAPGVLDKTKKTPRVDYYAYIKSSQWRAKRQEKLNQVGNRCQICNSTEYLRVHHRTYEHLGDEPLDDLTVLCRDCHKIFHEMGKLAQNKNDA